MLRYNILFSIPFVNHKYLLHTHSHFAFSGWITQALFILLIYDLNPSPTAFSKYKWLLIANLLTAYGMLFSFPFQGYGVFSIIFATLSILTQYFFAIVYWKDLNKMPRHDYRNCFKWALVFNVLSSIGTFAMAYYMATSSLTQYRYYASIYFYLHFQYNGWFFFACLGLLLRQIKNISRVFVSQMNRIVLLFALTCIPCYFLSALWLNTSVPVYYIIVAAAILQTVACFLLIKNVLANKNMLEQYGLFSKTLLVLVAVALGIKFVLQLASASEVVSQLVYSYRPVVIAYLHLVLLGIISLFILTYACAEKLVDVSSMAKKGLIIFIAGIFANEGIIMVQSILAFNQNVLPFTNEMLLIAAIILFTGITWFNFAQKKTSKKLVKQEGLATYE